MNIFYHPHLSDWGLFLDFLEILQQLLDRHDGMLQHKNFKNTNLTYEKFINFGVKLILYSNLTFNFFKDEIWIKHYGCENFCVSKRCNSHLMFNVSITLSCLLWLFLQWKNFLVYNFCNVKLVKHLVLQTRKMKKVCFIKKWCGL